MTDTIELTDEELMHYGVLGMKWGKTRAKASASQVKSARSRLITEKNKIKRAESKAESGKTNSERVRARKDVDKMKTSFLKNPDRVVAARMTQGEKQLAVAFSWFTGGLGGVALIGATSARSRRIERKQEKNKYDKK